MVFYSYAETKQTQVDGQYYSTPPHPLHTEHPSRVLLSPRASLLTAPWKGEKTFQMMLEMMRGLFNQNKE